MAIREILKNLLLGNLKLTPEQISHLKSRAPALRRAADSCADCRRHARIVLEMLREVSPQLKMILEKNKDVFAITGSKQVLPRLH